MLVPRLMFVTIGISSKTKRLTEMALDVSVYDRPILGKAEQLTLTAQDAFESWLYKVWGFQQHHLSGYLLWEISIQTYLDLTLQKGAFWRCQTTHSTRKCFAWSILRHTSLYSKCSTTCLPRQLPSVHVMFLDTSLEGMKECLAIKRKLEILFAHLQNLEAVSMCCNAIQHQ